MCLALTVKTLQCKSDHLRVGNWRAVGTKSHPGVGQSERPAADAPSVAVVSVSWEPGHMTFVHWFGQPRSAVCTQH